MPSADVDDLNPVSRFIFKAAVVFRGSLQWHTLVFKCLVYSLIAGIGLWRTLPGKARSDSAAKSLVIAKRKKTRHGDLCDWWNPTITSQHYWTTQDWGYFRRGNQFTSTKILRMRAQLAWSIECPMQSSCMLLRISELRWAKSELTLDPYAGESPTASPAGHTATCKSG
jgi:hypothetical protein